MKDLVHLKSARKTLKMKVYSPRLVFAEMFSSCRMKHTPGTSGMTESIMLTVTSPAACTLSPASVSCSNMA